jgi:hypothetical protein
MTPIGSRSLFDGSKYESLTLKVENEKIKCNKPMGYTPMSYVIGKRNDGTLRIMMP